MPQPTESNDLRIVHRIGSRTRITRPGIYTFADDVRHGGGTLLSETCVRIASDNVILDGGGHRIDGRGVSDTTGIAVAGDAELWNVAVLNLTLSDWDRGLSFENVTGGVVHNVRAVDNGYGISFENVRDVVVSQNHVSNNLLGVYRDAESDVELWDNTFESNHGGNVYHRRDCTD